MIRKLRTRLIAVSMIAMAVVLAAIISVMNILNYRSILSDADRLLEMIADNNGTFPEPEESPSDNSGDTDPPEPPDGSRSRMSAELPYETRYFSVLLSSEGETISSDTGNIAAVDTSRAVSFAKEIFKSGKTSGFLNDYRYLRSAESDNIRIIFLDVSDEMESFRKVLLLSTLASLGGLAAVFLLVVFFSRRIVRPVAESYEKQKRFITDAGHDIKTPIAIIDADASALEMDVGPDEWLEDIHLQTKRLTRLTNDLIFLSRMEEPQNKMNRIDFPVSDVAGEEVRSFQTLAAAQGKKLTEEIQPMLSCNGDEKNIRRLFSILLDNAVKYTPEGGEIRFRLFREGKYTRLEVENTAEQITKETLRHMFDRFYRADSSRSSEKGGYGIGLSIAQAIVAAHKGKISASLPEAGKLRITVLLP